MCSWCWGFKKTFTRLQEELPSKLKLTYLLGGLAKDTNNPMPKIMQRNIQDTWHQIEKEIPGTSFNFSFWQNNTPRRSTYPACRAVIAARKLNPNKHQEMIIAIQDAYYKRALNPSDNTVLAQLASEISLDKTLFNDSLDSPEIKSELDHEVALSRKLGAQGFPSLIINHSNKTNFISIDYNNHQPMLDSISLALNQ